MSVARGIAARFTKKNNDGLSRNVKGSQKCSRQANREDWHVALESECEDCVFAEESAERRTTDQCETADCECNERDFQFRSEVAHFPNLLFVMKTDDDRTGREEEKRFEKRVREKMKHRGFVRREPDSHDHVTEL